MTHKTVSMWKVTRNLILTDVCAIALFWLIPSVKMLVLPRIWRGNMVLVIVSLAVMAVLV